MNFSWKSLYSVSSLWAWRLNYETKTWKKLGSLRGYADYDLREPTHVCSRTSKTWGDLTLNRLFDSVQSGWEEAESENNYRSWRIALDLLFSFGIKFWRKIQVFPEKMSLKWVLVLRKRKPAVSFFECTFYGIGVIARIDEIVIG